MPGGRQAVIIQASCHIPSARCQEVQSTGMRDRLRLNEGDETSLTHRETHHERVRLGMILAGNGIARGMGVMRSITFMFVM